VNRRSWEGKQIVAERWARADEAPRLSAEVPTLRSLRLALSEWRAGSEIPGTAHSKLFVMQSAPALFFVPCGDSRCKDGGHDVTHEIMSALRARQTTLEGEDACRGGVGDGECTRVLRYTVTATYG
jgi:hypothetical protein